MPKYNMEAIPEVILNSGCRIPVLGFRTAAHPIPSPELVESAIMQAIELGYRHFDTASVYQTEAPLGRAIAQALKQGLVASRDQLFITSKLWCTDAHHDSVLPALHKSLKALGLDYLDLYLIHWPVRLKGEMELSFDAEEAQLLPFDAKGTWEAMEECQRLGLTKSIGVSNFTRRELSELLAHATIPPAVNQVEMHPYWQQKELRDFCASNNIHVSAYSPLGGKGAFWGSNLVLDSNDIKEIARAKGKTAAQVCLRWAFEQSVSFLPKSFNKERMKQNMDIFNWNLNEEDSQKISFLPQQKISAGPKSFKTRNLRGRDKMQAVKEKLSDIAALRQIKHETKAEEQAEKDVAKTRMEVAREIRKAKEAEAAMDLHVAKVGEKVQKFVQKHPESVNPSEVENDIIGLSGEDASMAHSMAHTNSNTRR